MIGPRLVAYLLVGAALVQAQSNSDSGDASASASGTQGSGDASESSTNILRWKACGSIGFECAALSVPVCHDKSCANTDTLGLTITRYETATSDDAPTVWMVDEFTTDFEEKMLRIAMAGDVNVYGVNTRGEQLPYKYYESGGACSGLVRTFGYRNTVDTSYVNQVEDCSKWLTETLGENGATAFSLDNAAKDLHFAMTTVQEQVIKPTTVRTFVYTSASSTRTVQRLIALDLNDTAYTITGYIYENPSLMKLPTDYDKLGGDAMDKFLSSCDNDAFCKDKYTTLGTTMVTVLKETYATLDDPSATLNECQEELKEATYESASDLTPSTGVRRLMAWLVTYSTESAPLVAPFLYRLKRCSKDDVYPLNRIYIKVHNPRSPNWFSLAPSGETMQRLVLLSELWPSETPSQDELAKTVSSTVISEGKMLQLLPSYCAYTGSTASACASVYKRGVTPNPSVKVTYTPSKSLSSAVDAKTGMVGSKADVLILTTRLGLTGSAQAAEYLYDAYTSAGSSSSQTAVLVASDSVGGVSEMDSTTSLAVFGRFVSGKASQLNGKWYTADLSSSLDATPATSTYATASVSVAIATNDDHAAFGWFEFGEVWETQKNWYDSSYSGDDLCFGCSLGLSVLWWIVIVLGVIVVGGLVLVFVIIRHQRGSERRRFQLEAVERARRREQQDAVLAQELAYAHYQQYDHPLAPGSHSSAPPRGLV